MHKATKTDHADIVNTVLSYIYGALQTPLDAAGLAARVGTGPHHLQRLFRDETGKTLYAAIKSIRLQKAAGLLLTNRYATVREIGRLCGYASHTSFIKAFEGRFGASPGAWRTHAHLDYSQTILDASPDAGRSIRDFSGTRPVIRKTEPIRAAYIRHTGYDTSIRESWNRLYAWSLLQGLSADTLQIGLHHDNPTITPPAECAYVAAIAIPDTLTPHGSIGCFTIPMSVCAVFSITGVYGDVLRFMRYVDHIWLPSSGFEAGTLPAYAVYRKNHFLSDDGTFDLDFYLPIWVV